MSCLISLIGGQRTPIYLAHQHIQPNSAVLVHSDETRRHAEELRQFLKDRFRDCEISLWSVLPHDFKDLEDAADMLINKHADAILNFTGGNKIMSVAFYSAFMRAGKPTLYVNTSDSVIMWQGPQIKSEPIQVKVTIEDYIGLNYPNATVTSNREDPYRRLCRSIFNAYSHPRRNQNADFKELDSYRHFMSVVDHYSHIKSGDWRLECSYVQVEPSGNDVIINTDLDSDDIVIHKEAWLTYITGGWLERWAYHALLEKNHFDDIAYNVVLQLSPGNRLNEIDVLAISNSVPHFYECKTGKVESDAVTNLATSMKNYGGSYARGFIVSLYTNLHETVLQRCSDLRIRVLAGIDDLNEIGEAHKKSFRDQAL